MRFAQAGLMAFASTLAVDVPAVAQTTASTPQGGDFLNVFRNTIDTSTPAVAPPWALEPWFWEDDVNTAAAVWDLVNGCREHDLPIGAVLLDSPWSKSYNDFVFDEARYPQPGEMIERLHALNIRIVLWMTHIINTPDSRADAPGSEENLYGFGKAKGYFVNDGETVKWWKGKGAMIDYTNPEAVAWWHGLMDRALALGVDGWKVDGAAELFLLTRRKTAQGTLSLRDYLDLYYRDTLHYGRQYKPDFVTMVRSVDIANSGGSDQAHAPFDAAPITWVGDQRHTWKGKGLDEAIRSVFKALERGYPLAGSDTGGYQTDPQHPGSMPRLLYLRWAQWNALTPFFLIGGHDEHRPWKFDAPFLEVCRRYLWLHHELVPFFYSQHVQASLREGTLMHVGPGKHEYLLGDALLVGVMADDRPQRDITFPEGHWLDYWDNRIHYQGGQTARVEVPEERSPVFVRLGSVIPLNVENDLLNHGSRTSKGWRTLDIYPSSAETRTILWDTASFPPQVGRDRTIVLVTPSEKGVTIRIEGGPARDTILRVFCPEGVSSVQRDRTSVPPAAGREEWANARSGWWYDSADQRLWIRADGARNTTIEVSR